MVRRCDNGASTGPALRSLLACAAVLLVCADAGAGQRFISSTRLTSDDSGATLSVTNLGAHTNFVLNVKRDDGAVVYFNGTEAARFNMPAGG